MKRSYIYALETTTVVCGVVRPPVCTSGRAAKANAYAATQRLRLD